MGAIRSPFRVGTPGLGTMKPRLGLTLSHQVKVSVTEPLELL